jgi:hypothetical protein
VDWVTVFLASERRISGIIHIVPQPRLKWVHDRAHATVFLDGILDEYAPVKELVEDIGERAVTLDLSAIQRINSIGVRVWIQLSQLLQDKQVFLRRCSPAIVNQLNCIQNFAAHARVMSVIGIYACDSCGTNTAVELLTASIKKVTDIPERYACSRCGASAFFDDFPDRYFGFLLHPH